MRCLFCFFRNNEEKVLTSIISLITSLGIYALIIFVFPKVMTNMSGGKYEVKPVESKVRFSDVAGIDEEKAQLEEIVKFLKYPQKYISSGARIPKGVLLNGAPGTGKTLLAKAIAGEAGVPFFQVNGSSFEEKFIGMGLCELENFSKKPNKRHHALFLLMKLIR